MIGVLARHLVLIVLWRLIGFLADICAADAALAVREVIWSP